MKERLIKLLFEEELIPIPEDEESLDNSNYILEQDDIKVLYKLFKLIPLSIFMFCIYQTMAIVIYPCQPLGHNFTNNIVLSLLIVLYLNFLLDYFYVKEMCKNSPQNFNQKLLSKIKYSFLSIIISTMLGIYTIIYNIIQIISSNSYINYLNVIVIVLIIITCIGLGSRLINYLFKQIEILKNQTEGLI